MGELKDDQRGADASAPPVIVVLGTGGLETANRLKAGLAGASVHGLARRLDGAAAASGQPDLVFDQLGEHLRALYRAGTPIIGLCAAGILIRCLAEVVGARADAKLMEPPVLALAEDGSAVVPLLGGLAGVNTLARRIGALLETAPAITTSGELRFGTCLLNPPPGFVLGDVEHGKHFLSDLLAGERLTLEVEADGNGACAAWLEQHALPISVDEQADETADEIDKTRSRHIVRVGMGREQADHILMIHPRAVVAVVGRLSLAVASHTVTARINGLLMRHNIAAPCLAGLIFDMADLGHPTVDALSRSLNLPVRFVSPANGTDTTTNRFDDLVADIAATVGGAVKHSDTPDCLALILAPAPVRIDSVGQARGSLSVIGLGPGDKAMLAPAARTALAQASDILGYSTYVDMAGPFLPHQRIHGTDNREEMARARHAFELAASGRDVVMVSSGDPGVFAMAAAVLEALEQACREDSSQATKWSAVALSIVPGISAAMATAAFAGAPLGHDFCMLSLSDNLKPWSIIETRLRHAAQADLVMAFYNPISRARPWQLERALSIVREIREGGTAVVLGRDIGRPAQTLRRLTLADLTAADVDMRTMVIIGSSTTRHFSTSGTVAEADGADSVSKGTTEWTYTPRSYPAS